VASAANNKDRPATLPRMFVFILTRMIRLSDKLARRVGV
jgi:hypothetical protein